MRKIKLRAWDKNNKEFVKVGFHYGSVGSDPDAFILEQYTGVNDKNGKEAYENDIIQTKDGALVIKWEFTGWYCVTLEADAYFPLEKYITDFEVIGNIHEYFT